MSESENEDHSRGMLAFVLSLDVPGAFVKASTKVLQSQVKKFVEDDLNNRLPDVLESLGADQDNLEKIAETLAELGGEAAGEFAAVLGVPLLNSVLRCVKDASIKKEIRESEKRIHAHLDRIEVKIDSLRQEFARLLDDQIARLSARDFRRAVHFAETALQRPCRNTSEREHQIEDLREAVCHLTLVEADFLNETTAEGARFIISLLIGLCTLLDPFERWRANKKLSEAVSAIESEIAKSNSRLNELEQSTRYREREIDQFKTELRSPTTRLIIERAWQIALENGYSSLREAVEDNWKRLSWHKRLMHTAAIVAISIYLHKLRESDETGVMSKFAERRLIPIINPSVWEQACLQRSREIEELGRLIRAEQRLIREMDDFATTIRALARVANLPTG